MAPMAIDVYGAKYSESAWGPRGGVRPMLLIMHWSFLFSSRNGGF